MKKWKKLLLPAMCIYAADTSNCKCRGSWQQ